ncbi:MAG: site-specific DNA-methyltransferase [Clostridiales Family XIII bacterium]|jgi:adenine-specific DNA-methyltransferase|nr:site-specific DNA-methyltransferase [Clostridiales Family XIII bacterium]
MEKLAMRTPSLADANFAALAKLFPNAVTEAVDENGVVVRAIDKDVLAQEINAHVVEGREERYQFTWPDKKKSILLANAPIAAALRPCREESVDFDDTENLYIEGDNLDVLKLLRETYLNRVKMIYIDPPYNTGHDFVYEDDFAEETSSFLRRDGQFDEQENRLVTNSDSNGRFHTDWLNMLYPRLRLAKDLLADDGVIFISIDDNEVRNLRILCDEVFGERNLAACLPWQSRLSMQNDTDLSVNHEYILAYARNRRIENRRLKESNTGTWYQRDSFVFRPLPLNPDNYENPDNDPRGPWKADPFDAPHVRPNLTYPVTNPITGVQHLPPSGRCWRISPEKFSSALADNRIVWGKNGTGRPQLKVFYEEKKDFGSVDNSWFSGDKVGTATAATKELQELFGSTAPFDTPKPVSMVRKLLEIGFVRKDDIVMDFFSGSSTTAHAVMQMNAEDGGRRKFIMVQLPEICAEGSEAERIGYATICEIGKERIRRAGTKIKTDSSLTTGSLDVGFRVLKLDSANMKDVYYTPEQYANMQFSLEGFADNIKEDRSDEDLLFQAMLDLGIPLSAKISRNDEVFSVNDNHLIACFGHVDTTLITEIARKKPRYAVFRDSSFSSDSAMVNFEQVFATYSPSTIRKVL